MGKHQLFIVDVFAEEQYAGNQLAVVTSAGSLSEPERQRIAREMNFSETTFVISDVPRAGGYDVRIFPLLLNFRLPATPRSARRTSSVMSLFRRRQSDSSCISKSARCLSRSPPNLPLQRG